MEFEISKNSAITIIPFNTIEEVASQTVPYICSGTVAFSGGSTYDKLFSAWADLKPDITKATFFPVDERVVPLEHPDSNWGNAEKKFFATLHATANVENFATDTTSYTKLLEEKVGKNIIFGTIFLGVGDDGHTASLFPNSPAVDDMNSTVLKTESPKGIRERISLGTGVIAKAEEVITIIAGEGKRACLKWLRAKDMSKPFIKVLSKRERSILFVEESLLEEFEI